MRIIRHGDVMLIERTEKVLAKKRSPVIALGEATGHRHEVIEGDVYLDTDGTIVVRATEETTIQHLDRSDAVVEHGVLEIPPGDWVVRIERDCDPWTGRESGEVID